LILAAGIALVGFNLRTAVTSVTPLLEFIDADIGFNDVATSVLGMLPPLIFAIFGFMAAPLSARIGLEWTLAGGMALAAVGIAGRGLSGDAFGFLAWTVVAIAGLGLANVLVPPVIKRYFPNRIDLLTTAFTVSLVLGLGVPPLLTVPLTRALGWRTSVALWAVGAVIASLPWLWAALRRHAHRSQAGSAVPTDQPRPSRRPIWQSPTVWGVTALIACNSIAAFCLMTWLPKLMTDAGASVDEAANWLAFFTGGSALAYLIVPAWVARTRRPRAVITLFAVGWMVGIAGLTLAPGFLPGLWIAATRIGDACYAAGVVLMNLRTRHSHTLIAVSAFSQSAAHVLAATFTFAFGGLHNLTGGWLAPMALLFCVMPFGLAGGLLAARPRMVEDELA
jgi:CP family cyanate transporter-like MFS transporter